MHKIDHVIFCIGLYITSPIHSLSRHTVAYDQNLWKSIKSIAFIMNETLIKKWGSGYCNGEEGYKSKVKSTSRFSFLRIDGCYEGLFIIENENLCFAWKTSLLFHKLAFCQGLAFDLWRTKVLLRKTSCASGERLAVFIFHLRWPLVPSALNTRTPRSSFSQRPHFIMKLKHIWHHLIID